MSEAHAAWIELDSVHLDRGGRPVLKGLTASLSGAAIGLVGANGAGKSTLIGALLGVLRAHRGRIRILGLDLPGDAQEVRTRAGVMAEQAGVFPGGSGVEAVTFAGQLTGLRRKEALRRAHRALDALDVGEERYRKTAGYSTGMRQRCKLAMSLVHDPEVLVLDEPTVGLDPPGRLQLLELIRDLKADGRRILLSTHILHDAEFLCDELLLLDDGMVSYAGPIDELVGPRDSMMIATGRGLGGSVPGRLAGAGIETARGGPDEVRFRATGDADLVLFWRIVAEEGLEVRRLESATASFEDAVVGAMQGTRLGAAPEDAAGGGSGAGASRAGSAESGPDPAAGPVDTPGGAS